MESWLIWIIIGAIFIVAEIFSVSFFAGPIGLACLVAALINYAGATATWQLLGFSVTSVGLLLAVRPIWKRMMEDMSNKEVSGIDAYVGRQGKITETVDPQAETGRIKIGGEDWRAVSDKSIIIEEGSLATVIRIEGSKALCAGGIRFKSSPIYFSAPVHRAASPPLLLAPKMIVEPASIGSMLIFSAAFSRSWGAPLIS